MSIKEGRFAGSCIYCETARNVGSHTQKTHGKCKAEIRQIFFIRSVRAMRKSTASYYLPRPLIGKEGSLPGASHTRKRTPVRKRKNLCPEMISLYLKTKRMAASQQDHYTSFQGDQGRIATTIEWMLDKKALQLHPASRSKKTVLISVYP